MPTTKRTSATTTTTKTAKPEIPKKTLRPAEERIAELREKIDAIKQREVARQAKASPTGKALVAAARAVDKAIRTAEEQGEAQLQRGLEAARTPLAELLVGEVLRVGPRRLRA